MRRTKIYTKKGDKGKTSIKNSRVSKTSDVIRCLAYIDELQTQMGFLIFNMYNDAEYFIIKNIQKELFRISSNIAGYDIKFDASLIKDLEQRIDEITSSLPPLKNFIIAGCGMKQQELYAHACRTKCRLLETYLPEHTNEDIRKFINRLSDYLFMLVRKYNTNELKIDIKKNKIF